MSAQNAAKQSESQRLEEKQQLNVCFYPLHLISRIFYSPHLMLKAIHFQILVHEKQVELERLKIELQELQRLEAQQNEFLQKLRLPI